MICSPQLKVPHIFHLLFNYLSLNEFCKNRVCFLSSNHFRSRSRHPSIHMSPIHSHDALTITNAKPKCTLVLFFYFHFWGFMKNIPLKLDANDRGPKLLILSVEDLPLSFCSSFISIFCPDSMSSIQLCSFISVIRGKKV